MIKLKYFIETIRPEIQLVYFTALLAGLFIAFNGTPFINSKIVIGFIAFFLVQSVGSYFLNAFADTEIDAINKPSRASAKGLISEEELLTISFLGFIIGIGLAFLVSPVFFLAQVLTAVIGVIYSLKPIHLKSRGLLCTLVIVYAHSISLISGAALVGNPLDMPFLLIVVLIQAIIAFFVAFSKDIPDIKGDQKHGANTLAVLLGERNSTKLMVVLPVVSLLYFLVPKLWVLAPILFASFIYSIYPLREKKYMLTFKRGVIFTIIQNLLILTILLVF